MNDKLRQGRNGQRSAYKYKSMFTLRFETTVLFHILCPIKYTQ